jgi:hypothetical protein
MIYIILIFQGTILFATEQIPNIFLYNGNKYQFHEIIPVFSRRNAPELIEAYFRTFPEKQPEMSGTSLYRGYVATYEIINDELFVVDILEHKRDGKYNRIWVSIIKECLNGNDKMKIIWFTGFFILPQGGRVSYDYINNVYQQTFEYYKIIYIQNGNFIKEININYGKYVEFYIKNFNKIYNYIF